MHLGMVDFICGVVVTLLVIASIVGIAYWLSYKDIPDISKHRPDKVADTETTEEPFIHYRRLSLFEDWCCNWVKKIEFNPDWIREITGVGHEILDPDKLPRVLEGSILKFMTPNEHLGFIFGTRLGNILIINYRNMFGEEIFCVTCRAASYAIGWDVIYDIGDVNNAVKYVRTWFGYDNKEDISKKVAAFLEVFTAKKD